MKCMDAALTRTLDAYIAERQKISVRTLMRNAGKFIAETVAKDAPKGSRFLIFCGSGNNGGDGYAAAVILHEMGYKAYCIDVMESGPVGDAALYFYRQYRKTVGYPLTSYDLSEEKLMEHARGSYAIVEAIYGSGFHGEITGNAKNAVRFMNRVSGVKKYAVDIPAGVNGSNGNIAKEVFFADVTLSLGIPKRGLFLYPGCLYVGEVVGSPIGMDIPRAERHFSLTDEVLTEALVRTFLPSRRPDLHKGTAGRVHLVVGSELYPGAAMLASAASARVGAGYTVLFSPRSVCTAAVTRQPSLLVRPCGDVSEALLSAENGAGAILAGSGSGVSFTFREAIYDALSRKGAPLILDADALTALSEEREESEKRLAVAEREVILTPHPGEFARLLGITPEECEKNRYEAAKAFSMRTGTVLVLKGVATLIASPDGRVYINTSGSDALAKAGSGDVLAGLIATFASAGVPAAEAAAAAVYLHGCAGEELAATRSRFGVLPEELPLAVAGILAAYEKE